MNITNTSAIVATLILFSFSSCQNIELGAENTTNNTSIPEGQTRLALTLANDSKEAEISWPVNIYIFNSDNTCTDTKTLTSATTTTEFTLPVGTYSIYAVGGMSSDNYNIPTKDNATSTSVLSLKDGVNEHADIMTAQQSGITLTAGQSSEQTLNFTRKVAKITNLTITDVSEDVTEVTVTLSPVFSAINLDGTFTDENKSSLTIKLTKDNTDGTTWKSDCNSYIFPNNGDMNIKYQFKTATTTREFNQTTSDITANHKISINANYKKEVLTASMTCVLSGATWDNDVTISCTVDEVKMTKIEDNNNTDDNTDGSVEPTADFEAKAGATIPELGQNLTTKTNTFFYVIKKETYGNNTYVTVMNRCEEIKISDTRLSNQAEIKAAVDAKFEKSINKNLTDIITKWRLPKKEELKYIHDNYNELVTATKNDKLMKFINASQCYYCTNADGDIVGYSLFNDTEVPLYTDGGGARLNGFAIVKYPK